MDGRLDEAQRRAEAFAERHHGKKGLGGSARVKGWTCVTSTRGAYTQPVRSVRAVGVGGSITCALLVAATLSSSAIAEAKQSCDPVVNPYEGTRYDGIDLRRIRAKGVHCPKARRVATGAHKKALGITPPVDGVRTYRWNGWEVVGDIRDDVDRYVARRRDRTVRWVF